MTTDEYLGSAESADRIGIGRSTFQRWVDAGKITPVVRGSGKGPRGVQYFAASDVEQLRAEREADLRERLESVAAPSPDAEKVR